MADLEPTDETLVEELLSAYYTAHPTRACSPALAELCGVDLGSPIPYDVFIAKGGSLFGIEKAFRAILPIIERVRSDAYAEATPLLAEAHDVGFAKGRREGIEEAAKVAEGVLGVNATAIRALAEKQP